MIKSYRNLCSVEVQTIETKGSYYSLPGFNQDNSDGVCFSPAHYCKVSMQLNNCKAAIVKKYFGKSSGRLGVMEGSTLTKIEGIGNFQSVCTNQHIYLLELDNSEIFVSPRFFLGYVGNVIINTFSNLAKEVKAVLPVTKVGKVGRTETIVGLGSFLQHCTSYTLDGLHKNFIVLKGSGFVILTFPFSLNFLQETEQTSDSVTTPSKVFFTENNSLCTINGQCKICTSMIGL